MSKKGLEIPFSISNISNTPDISSASLTGIFDDKKQKDDQSEYKIKVKKPNDFMNKNFIPQNNPSKTQVEKNNNEFDLS
jgi:hypothetical protein